jgi:zinc and cadmium transporter
MRLVWITSFSLLGSLGSLSLAGLFLLFRSSVRDSLIPRLISYAIGTLLGGAFLGLIPHALDHASAFPVMATVLGGIILFFVLEKMVLWRHCHVTECEVHSTAGPLILLGDAFHNFTDGIAIGAAFLGSVSLGVATALAIIVHEIPQEVGDFAILLDGGYSRSRAFAYNALSSLSTLPAAVAVYLSARTIQPAIPYLLALSAASFIYVAIGGLIPGLHEQRDLGASARQLLLILAGIGTIMLFHHG